MRMALTLNASIEFGIACNAMHACMYAFSPQCTRFHPFFVSLCVCVCGIYVCAKFMNNGFPNSIQFNSIPLKMDNGYIQFHSGIFFQFLIHFGIVSKSVMALTRTVYVRLLLDLLFCTRAIFLCTKCRINYAYALFHFFAAAFGRKWGFRLLRISLWICPEMGDANCTIFFSVGGSRCRM